MTYENGKVKDIKIAYIGGGSRGWAWGLMSDLVSAEDISGTVNLYDIDLAAAKNNAVIGEKFNSAEGAKSHWTYRVLETLDGALEGADFVIISILPGTFEEMKSDVHTPEKYGIYQSVGDTTGPGGIIRALRTIPMFEVIAEGIKNVCPDAWVINYTNPMTLCVKTLYRVFPQIKAFGCCHEVFGTQNLLAEAYASITGEEKPSRQEININVVGINHFTWITSAYYKNTDLFPIYREFAEKYKDGYTVGWDEKKFNNVFAYTQKVKFDLFSRFGYIAAAGDRHLAEFCPGKWYLSSPESVREWGFWLTPVSWRVDDLKNRLAKSAGYIDGTITPTIKNTGEDGVKQMRALLGLGNLKTNVNIPNYGQIPNLPLGAVVETNAFFSSGTVSPIFSYDVPKEIYPLVSRIVSEQEIISDAGAKRDLEAAFLAFICDPLVTTSIADSRKLFYEMIGNTKKYLGEYLK
ncbi:MAG: alpha-glucosidase/alpha-galactosidase [Clostridia bacterium]|nr:alpha-glucosidase/alpha-galactosidase [Clostridia bacterium]